ncbi:MULTISPECIES: hypothetical protein [Gammaproteobacteria]|uniref:Uncharacterized protein n=3 Tax=Vibrio TaxID=662 RepID=A0A1P8DR42_VIBPH|nr:MULTISPECIES: hypothetical protein [Vibrionaceae]APU90732.1 hypothetical protein [Vibrio alginolyticus]APU91602.1 hypothetical protein [Vibrio parahaemolyticus]EHY9845636.1 hypothetical protein [Vibrio cholerae]EIO3215728.1 hypothetical protein [Vibrio parahaemolyticus]KAB1503387.1 hypothetical protein FD717_019855 [Photobacterium damselae subsp. damselae]
MSKNTNDIFTNRTPLEFCVYPKLDRCVGLRIGYPHYREGANGVVCEVEAEYPTLNTHSSVAWPLVEELNSYTIKKQKQIIEDIDEAVAELLMHKANLLENILKLEDGELDLNEQAKMRYEENSKSSVA